MADLPYGTIVMFSGKAIPDGWLLCDGRNNTPNLIDRFILGGELANINKKNDKSFKNHDNYNSLRIMEETDSVPVSIKISVDGHALTESEMPSHSHKQGDLYDLDYGFAYGHWTENSNGHWINGGKLNNNTQPRYAPISDKTGNGNAHSHSASADSEATKHKHQADIMPPYFILAFIMYTG
ncbi:tail fiber protein [Pseudomonas chlororaphis]|uniref:Phage tail collar domain-containing protein n=1 Tax=Pseudomonas chlororaphis TaxID=587753 RepID=A0AAX3FV59_9PSED|nr:tail fiber protein [Pseudomonas chlororaphis]AZC39471.1 hypothetical protein C4K37_5106 [Pseudomonas chlororaphis subsp. piscium]AZC46022.1 hypothetical protein C4K36_5119 [Pseudomonas chlororaphis subsp. piscium]WDG71555.1 tail fiber protein [Pseudomonas chlororaphis]WDH30661.1 tail fiber protein [Pseudomonas chlororaphis]WDH70080.1 tail fiber protein [Pseudomonas chlororaphis]